MTSGKPYDNKYWRGAVVRRCHPQLQSPFIATPPNVGVDVDLMMNKVSTFIINAVKTSSVNVNLNRDQLAGYKSLKARTDLQISKSDKSGDFVVSNIDTYKEITINHIKSNEEVYKWIPPTRKKQGVSVEVKCPLRQHIVTNWRTKGFRLKRSVIGFGPTSVFGEKLGASLGTYFIAPTPHSQFSIL